MLILLLVVIVFASVVFLTKHRSTAALRARSNAIHTEQPPRSAAEALQVGADFTLTGRSLRLSSNGRVPIVGESYRSEALADVVAGVRVPRAGDWDNAVRRDALLIPEPTNPYDGHAVRVFMEGQRQGWVLVGYLARDTAAEYVTHLTEIIEAGRVPLAEGRIVRSGNGLAAYLHLADPDNMLFANDEPDVEVVDAARECAVVREQDHQDVLSALTNTLYWATLHAGTVTAGKYAGEPTLEVRIGGHRVGELTAAQGKRYASVLGAHGAVCCEARVFRGSKYVEVSLALPAVD